MVTLTRKPSTAKSSDTDVGLLPELRSRAERVAEGQALRERVPRSSHASWLQPAKRRDPIAILEQSSKGRLPELLPIRYGRMLHSPFTFMRGSAALMAHDLASTPSTGIRVQACGDCHLLNFGLFATPERNLVFDINDFDETLPGPWEWDCKRLAVSVVLAARDIHLSAAEARDCVLECVCAYRQRLREYSRMSPMEVWYARQDVETITAMAPKGQTRKNREEIAEKAHAHVAEHLFPKIVCEESGHYRFIEHRPTLFHVAEAQFEAHVHDRLADYRQSLPDERRVLLDRYRLEDFAMKVVGIGSVGTRCYIVLLVDKDGHPLLLQFKEACRSVLEPYCGKSQYQLQGQRIVVGQRLMQSASDIFLGWVRGRQQHDFFVRQLRDMKYTAPVEKFSAVQLKRYAQVCGWTLARAHAKSGDAASISGYLGGGDAFELALATFAQSYADQTERDHAALVEAVRTGRIQAQINE